MCLCIYFLLSILFVWFCRRWHSLVYCHDITVWNSFPSHFVKRWRWKSFRCFKRVDMFACVSSFTPSHRFTLILLSKCELIGRCFTVFPVSRFEPTKNLLSRRQGQTKTKRKWSGRAWHWVDKMKLWNARHEQTSERVTKKTYRKCPKSIDFNYENDHFGILFRFFCCHISVGNGIYSDIFTLNIMKAIESNDRRHCLAMQTNRPKLMTFETWHSFVYFFRSFDKYQCRHSFPARFHLLSLRICWILFCHCENVNPI